MNEKNNFNMNRSYRKNIYCYQTENYNDAAKN